MQHRPRGYGPEGDGTQDRSVEIAAFSSSAGDTSWPFAPTRPTPGGRPSSTIRQPRAARRPSPAQPALACRAHSLTLIPPAVYFYSMV